MSSRENITGLPELPEGQWWEVRPHVVVTTRFRSYGPEVFVDSHEDGYEVCIMTNETVPAETKPGKHWWSAPVVTPERTKPVAVETRHITNPIRYQNALTYRAGVANFSWSTAYELVGEEFITPEMVLKAAKDCIDQIEEAARSKAEDAERSRVSLGLVGKYPPKTLSL